MKKWMIITLLATVAVSAQAAKVKKDANGDGRVTKDEYVEYFNARRIQKGKEADSKAASRSFDKRDANQDGNLTKEEEAAFDEK